MFFFWWQRRLDVFYLHLKIYVFPFLSFFSCRSWSRRTSSWSRSWTNSATSSGRSTPCWLSGAEPHTLKHTQHTHTQIQPTHSHNTHSHTFTTNNGQEDSVVNWTCDRVPQTGWGCTLQKKLGLWQYQPVSWRRRETIEGKTRRDKWRRKSSTPQRVEEIPNKALGGRVLVTSVWATAENILSTSIFYISISIKTELIWRVDILFYLFVGTSSIEGLCL